MFNNKTQPTDYQRIMSAFKGGVKPRFDIQVAHSYIRITLGCRAEMSCGLLRFIRVETNNNNIIL